MTTQELELKTQLQQRIEDWLDDVVLSDHDFGWISENIVSHMTDAAFNVLLSNKDLNNFMKQQDLLK